MIMSRRKVKKVGKAQNIENGTEYKSPDMDEIVLCRACTKGIREKSD